MPRHWPSRTPHRRLATRALRIALGVALLAPLGAGVVRAELPPYEEHHPRLLLGAEDVDGIYAAIQTDPTRRAVWLETQTAAAQLVTLEPDSLLDYYYGFDHVEKLALLSTLDPGPAAATDARAVIDALLWQCREFDTEQDPFLATLGVSLRLHNLAWGYDLAGWAATSAERDTIADEMLLYMREMCTSFDYTRFLYNPYVSNKGISIGAMITLAALALEADLPGDPAVQQGLAVGQEYIDFGLSQMVSRDGGYREGLGYMVWAFRTLLPTWNALDRLHARPWDPDQLEAILECTAYQAFDEGGGAFLNRNDHITNTFIASRHHSLFEFATAFGPKPDFARWLLRRTSGDLGHDLGLESDPVATILWHRSGPETGPEGFPHGRFFPDAGFWVYRTAWPGDPLEDSFAVTLEAAQFRGGHAQEDVGNFTLRAFGHGFALDNGAGLPAKETEAHSLPLVGSKGQHNAGSSIGTDGKLRRFLAGPRWEALRADMTAAYTTHSHFNDPDYPFDGIIWSWGYDGGNPMRRAWREFLLLPGQGGELPTLWIRDRIDPLDVSATRIDWRMHLGQDAALSFAGNGLWHASTPDGTLRMQLLSPDPGAVDWAANTFDNQNEDPDSRVLDVGLVTSSAEFVWQMAPLRPGEEEPVVLRENYLGGQRIYSTRGARERKLLLQRGVFSMIADADTLDGSWGLVERENGAKRTLLVDGTRLIEDGQRLITLWPAASAGCEGDTVRISAYVDSFRVWAPEAVAVLAAQVPVGFERVGDYVRGPAPLVDAPPVGEPAEAALHPWPNPGPAPIRFTLGEAAAQRGPIELAIYDLRGRRVASRRLPAGAGDLSTLEWSGDDEAGRPLPSGIYFARARAGGETATCKFVLLR